MRINTPSFCSYSMFNIECSISYIQSTSVVCLFNCGFVSIVAFILGCCLVPSSLCHSLLIKVTEGNSLILLVGAVVAAHNFDEVVIHQMAVLCKKTESLRRSYKVF